MEVIISLFLAFLLPVITAPTIARRRLDLSVRTLCWRFGLIAAVSLGLFWILLALQGASEAGGGLGAMFMLILVLPATGFAFVLGAASAALGMAFGRRG